MCCWSCWPLTTPWKNSGWRAEVRHSVLWGNWQDRSSESQIFSGADFMSPILVSPHILKSTTILHGADCFSWLAEASWDQKFSTKNMWLIACTPPTPLPKSHIYYPTHTCHQTSLEQFHRAICGAVFWAAVLTLPQTLNLQLSHCALFLFSVDTTITSNLTLGGFKQQTFITRGSGDYEVQDQSAGRSDLMSGEDPNPGLQTPIFSCCLHSVHSRENKLARLFLQGQLFHSWGLHPHDLTTPKTMPPTRITLGVRVSTHEFGGA